MKKESFKSIVLTLLVVTNLVLAERILVNEKLWLSSYNFFVSTRINKKKNFVSVTKRLALPQNIVVNTGYQSSRFVYRRNSEYFDAINEAATKILKSAFSSAAKDISEVSSDDWYNALTSKSIYLYYPCSYTSDVFSVFLGNSETNLSFSDFSNILINESGNVFIESSEKYYKIMSTSSEIAPIIQKVTEENANEESVLNYSFDLNFDKNFGSQKTTLSPMTLIYSEPISANVIKSINPIENGIEIYDKTIQDVLDAFSINKNSARRYTEADGTLVYIENNGSLKISPSGILTFTARENGLNLKGTSTTSKIATFIDTINSAMNIDSDICMTSLLLGDNKQEFKFDYMKDGYSIKYKDNTSAISVTVENGYLTSYTQVLRHYIASEETTFSSDYISALDNVISRYTDSMPEIRINKMFPAYIDNFSGNDLNIDWFIDVNNIIAE